MNTDLPPAKVKLLKYRNSTPTPFKKKSIIIEQIICDLVKIKTTKYVFTKDLSSNGIDIYRIFYNQKI